MRKTGAGALQCARLGDGLSLELEDKSQGSAVWLLLAIVAVAAATAAAGLAVAGSLAPSDELLHCHWPGS